MSDTDNTTPTTDGQGRADIIAQAREALAFSDSLISSDELYDLAPDLARIAIAADELAEALKVQHEVFGLTPEAITALAAFQAAKEGKQ